MSKQMALDITWSGQADLLTDLRARTLPRVAIALAGLGVGGIVWASVRPTPIEPAFLGLLSLCFAISIAIGCLVDARPTLTAGIVAASLVGAFRLALEVWPPGLVAPWLVLVVLAVGLLLGWRWSAGLVCLVTGLLTTGLGGELFAETGLPWLNALLLSWAVLGTGWLLTHPLRVALGWAWEGYQQAQAAMAEARQRQAELGRLSKSLAESYDKIAQLNRELERAWRAAQEARRRKEQFAAAISHELRTPLNLIIGYCELMVLDPEGAYGQRLPANYRGDLEVIYRNACHLSALVDDILDLSQIEAERMALHREWTALDRVIMEAVATVETLFRDRALTLRTEIAAGLQPLFIDPTRIRQILINLLTNAARFTEEGGVTVRAAVEGDAVIVAVQDTGPGIPPEDLPHIFEEFRQVGGARWRRGGSGLGLTVSRRFAELHGGTLWVESTLGQGSTFFLKLPLAADAPPLVGGPGLWEERLTRRVTGERVHRLLVLDSSGETYRILQRYLDGYDLRWATTPEQGQQILGEGPVHAVVLTDPATALLWQALCRRVPEARGLPVVTCPLTTPRRQAAELGVLDYLVKPITRPQVQAALRQARRCRSHLKRVLLVEDDEEMSRLLTRMVVALLPQATVVTATDGQQALTRLREAPPDLVLLDLVLPGVDGYQVLESMRRDPVLRTIPVVVITAHQAPERSIVAPAVSLAREGGLTVAEVVRWIRTSLETLWALRSEPALSEVVRG